MSYSLDTDRALKARVALSEQALAHGFQLCQTGPAQMPMVQLEDDPERDKINCFCNEAVKRGVYMHPWHNMFTCAAHLEDIPELLQRTDGAFAALKVKFG